MKPVRTTFRVALAITLLSGGAALIYRHFRVREFHEVAPGRVYRSGQPEHFDWARLMSKYHLRTVISLRPLCECDDGFWFAEEKRAAEHFGFQLVELPLAHHVPTSQQADEFLACLTEPSSQPVLVHCRSGINRTGTMVALYRVQVQGWPLDRAVAEFSQIKGVPPKDNEIDFLRSYRRRSTPATPELSGVQDAAMGNDERH